MFKHFRKEEEGSVVEYVLLLCLIAGIFMTVAPGLRSFVGNLSNSVVDPTDQVTIQKPNPNPTPPGGGDTGTTVPPETGGNTTDEGTGGVKGAKYQLYKYSMVGVDDFEDGDNVKIVLSANNVNYSDFTSNGSNVRILSGHPDPKVKDLVELPYWIESWNPGGESVIWIKTNAKTPGYGKLYFVVAGNKSFTAKSDGTATFPFYDDFESGYLNPTKWKNTDGKTIVDGKLQLKKGQDVLSNKTFEMKNYNRQYHYPYALQTKFSNAGNNSWFDIGFTNAFFTVNELDKSKQGFTTSNGIKPFFLEDKVALPNNQTWNDLLVKINASASPGGVGAFELNTSFNYKKSYRMQNAQIGNIQLKNNSDEVLEIDAVYVKGEWYPTEYANSFSYTDEAGIIK